VAVDLASNIFGSLSDARVLVLGTGEIGSATAKAFSSRGAAHLAVAGRRGEMALEIAATLGAGTVPFEERNGLLSEFDVIVCSTSAPNAILSAASIAAAMRRRPARPILLIDLAMPRDIEAGASDLQNVFLYNLDDLAKIAETNRSAREAEVVRCRAILAEKADGLWSHLRKGLASAGEASAAPGSRNPAAGHAAAP
jgi:glutamyl-tRNA reductase